MSKLQTDLAKKLQLTDKQVNSVLTLLSEGNTIPFIARYRKEMTDGLDEVQIYEIEKMWHYERQLQERKEDIIRLITEQDKLTTVLHEQIMTAKQLQELEDIYRPYRQKKQTRATKAVEKGLEPLAQWLLSLPTGDPNVYAQQFISELVPTADEALQGALDIIAEIIADDAKVRSYVRDYTLKHGLIVTTVKDADKDEKKIYQKYYEHEEKLSYVASHRILAINRGEKLGVLRVKVVVAPETIFDFLSIKFFKTTSLVLKAIGEKVIMDSYKRLLAPAVERDLRNELSENAKEQSIYIFAENLKGLLMQSPLKGKTILGIDPAYRTGCKWAAVDYTGKMLDYGVIYPHKPQNLYEEAKQTLKNIIAKYSIDLLAIGNGTASRETEQLVAEVVKTSDRKLSYAVISEAGASVYSASQVAREEFPDLQVEERSAVSIARRLQDPLAELVKIDPKSIGVGQYQHDIAGKKLQASLDFVVQMVVNQVGVNVNTASVSLLQYVSGLSKTVAQNIVQMRETQGRYVQRKQLKNIPRLGEKTYEQAIGFLRIIDGSEPLDRTAIHPEQYELVDKLLQILKVSKSELGTDCLKERLDELNTADVLAQLGIGEMTFSDIVNCLKQPERDVRTTVEGVRLRSDILKIEDLAVGMTLDGTVRNIVDFGAFIDIGVKQDGLVHISKMSKKRIKHPLDLLTIGQVVTTWVHEIDKESGRISLSLLPVTVATA